MQMSSGRHLWTLPCNQVEPGAVLHLPITKNRTGQICVVYTNSLMLCDPDQDVGSVEECFDFYLTCFDDQYERSIHTHAVHRKQLLLYCVNGQHCPASKQDVCGKCARANL